MGANQVGVRTVRTTSAGVWAVRAIQSCCLGNGRGDTQGQTDTRAGAKESTPGKGKLSGKALIQCLIHQDSSLIFYCLLRQKALKYVAECCQWGSASLNLKTVGFSLDATCLHQAMDEVD